MPGRWILRYLPRIVPSGAVCLVYRGTNSYNAVVTEQIAVSKDGKRGTWNKLCGGQTATDYSNARRLL